MNIRLLSRLLLLSSLHLVQYTHIQAKYPKRAASKAAQTSRKQQKKEQLKGGIHELKDERRLPRLLKGNQELWVFFYANTCGTCKRMERILKEYSSEHPNLPIIRVNRSRARRITRQYQVKGSPTILVFKNGILKKRIAGFKTLKKLAKAVESL